MIVRFKLENFYSLKDGIFVSKDLSSDTRIYKYMDLSALFRIDDGEFHVCKRKVYTDRWEAGYDDLRGVDHLYSVGLPIDMNEVKRRRDIRQQSTHLLTSCFTLTSHELNFMWRDYTRGYTGIRIETTVAKFVESLTLDDYNVYIAPMTYDSYDIGVINPNFLFSKRPWYEPERELRFYFIPKKEKLEENDDHVYIPCSGVTFIDGLILSPMFPGGLSRLKGWIYEALCNHFPEIRDKIMHSKVNESI